MLSVSACCPCWERPFRFSISCCGLASLSCCATCCASETACAACGSISLACAVIALASETSALTRGTKISADTAATATTPMAQPATIFNSFSTSALCSFWRLVKAINSFASWLPFSTASSISLISASFPICPILSVFIVVLWLTGSSRSPAPESGQSVPAPALRAHQTGQSCSCPGR